MKMANETVLITVNIPEPAEFEECQRCGTRFSIRHSDDKFYLKPPLRQPIQHDLISQLYGNILIEKIAVNNKPNYLKFLATFYSDRLYQEPNPFDELLDRIFDTTTHG
jgi:hypothetical protein